jgi:hypothetical protein
VRVAIPGGGTYFAMYPFAPNLRILSGSLQSLLGLYDHAELSGSSRARTLFRAAEPTAREAVLAHDTGSWSLYSRGGGPSPLNYHRLVVKQLAALCDRLGRAIYCEARRRFARYEHVPPALRLLWGGRGRTGAAAPVTFTVSQPATLRLQILRGGRTVLSRTLHAGAGRQVVSWTPSRAGRYRLTVTAIAPSGGRTTRRAMLAVTKRRTHDEGWRDGSRHRRDGDRRGRRKPPGPARGTPRPAPSPEATPTPAPTAPPDVATPAPTDPPEATPAAPDSPVAPDPTTTPDPGTTSDPSATPDPTATPAGAVTQDPSR